jgi:DNA-directed RNA polymerase subunit RPC12/RpoP
MTSTDDLHGGSDFGPPPKRTKPVKAAPPAPGVAAKAPSPRKAGWLTGPLVAGGLLVIIALAVGVSLYLYFFSGESSPLTHYDPDTHFECTKCQAKFQLNPREFAAAPGEPSADGLTRIDCPKCKAKNGAVVLLRCPKCGTYFLPARARPAATATTAPKDDCPKCGAVYPSMMGR